MATIKSYTDIDQSRKLAEILPLESADMWWLYVTSQGKHIAMMYEEPDPHYIGRMESYGIKDAAIRCWSLAALLGILPVTVRLLKDGNISNTGDIKYSCESSRVNIHDWFDNPIDACVAMIEKLNELKML